MPGNLQYIERLQQQPWWEFTMSERSQLAQLNQKIAGAETLDQVMELFFRSIRPLCPCDRIGLAFIEEEGMRVTARWAKATYAEMQLKTGYSEDLHGSSLEQVLESGRPRIINNLQEYLKERPNSHSTQLVVGEGLLSSMTCPLTVDGRIAGLLFISSCRPQMFGRHQLAMFNLYSERLSQAVEKAWRIHQLESVNRAYTELLGFVSHELKNPVASLVTDGRLLEGGYLGPMTPEQTNKVRRMISKGEYLLSLVRKYLDLARIESGSMEADIKPCTQFIRDVVEPSIEIVLPQFEERDIHFERDYGESVPTCLCDRNLIRIVLINLLGNAVKYGNESGRIRLTIAPEESELGVSVWNEGPGFEERDRVKLFRKFSRLPGLELMSRKGTGLGLYTSWKIIQLHGGRITGHSQQGQWAEFTIHIPLSPGVP
ncbi:MAG: GAF domain-containing sensor histidine kinase [Verrucomicrobiota bacterium]|nr:GAF domain-containing sensor histidine kinase [Verrucomicrobiota bacterium]